MELRTYLLQVILVHHLNSGKNTLRILKKGKLKIFNLNILRIPCFLIILILEASK